MNANPTYDLIDLGEGQPVAINASGKVVGNAPLGAWIWDGKTRTTLKFNAHFEGAPSSMYFTAYSVSNIDNAGQIFGKVMLVPNSQNFVNFFLRPLSSTAVDVVIDVTIPVKMPNLTVGAVSVGGKSHAALTVPNVIDLNYQISDLGWVVQQATDTNPAGQIIGYGTKDGVQHGFLLNPKVAPIVITPPSTALSLSISLYPKVTVRGFGPCEILFADNVAGPWKSLGKINVSGKYDFYDTDGSQSRLYRINK